MSELPANEQPAMSTAMAVIFYGGMLGLAWVLGVVWLDLDLLVWHDRWNSPLWLDAGLGLLLGLATVYISRILERRTAWARVLTEEFRKILGSLKPWQAFVFAVTSGVGEEVLFRGFLQQALSDSLLGGGPLAWGIGLVVASVIFGAIHIGPDREKFLPWTFMAIVMGFGFGALYLVTGNVLGPIIAHFTINFINIIHISRSTERPTPPTE